MASPGRYLYGYRGLKLISDSSKSDFLSRYLYGYRGLKFVEDTTVVRDPKSISVWISWIEIAVDRCLSHQKMVDICMDIVD